MTSERRADPKPASDRVYYFVHRVIHALVRTFTRYSVSGQENMPAGGAFLYVSNHLSFFDAPVVFLNSPARQVMFGADKYRAVPLLGRFLEAMGVIWVARGEADMDAMKAALGVLKSGRRLAMAPEGTRSRTGGLQSGKPGAAYLADRARVPVVPISITGTEKVFSEWKHLRRPVIHAVIGPPFLLPGDSRAKGAQLEAHTELIMCHLAAGLPPAYRGIYADHPLLRQVLAERSAAGQPS